MIECYKCGFWDSDFEQCCCSSTDMWYACPIESKKPENQKELDEMAKWYAENKQLVYMSEQIKDEILKNNNKLN